MPELPEVEIVCQNLNSMMGSKSVVEDWHFYRAELRTQIPKAALKKLIGQKILQVKRRAKFILFDLGEYTIVSHLGMTGSWREESFDWKKQKHDHLALQIKPDRYFVYADPRRFGFIEVWKTENLSKRFTNYGLEPLEKTTNFDELTILFKKIQSPIKTSLMNQKLLVGVGNIYASEILFAAKVSPLKKASSVTHKQYALIWLHTQKILNKAISKGGSTIENYRNSFGEKGGYQSEFNVYGRMGCACLICNTTIKQKVMAGRSTFWCAVCQK